MLKIRGRRDSFNTQKVMWCVAELGIPHERIDAGGERCHLYRKEDREVVLIFPGDSGVSCLFVFRSLDEAKRFLSSR